VLGLGAVIRFDRELGAAADELHDLWELIFGQGKDDGNGLDLSHEQQACRVGGMHDVARIDRTQADDARDG